MADTTAADKRSVIKNATQGGLIRNPLQNGLISNPLQSGNGVVGKGNTIATKEEINQAKATQGLTQKPMTVNPKYATANKTPVSTPATTTQKSATTNTKPMTIDPNLERRKLQDSYNVMNPSNPANPFNNPLVQPVNDIKVVHNSADNNINTKTGNGVYDYNRNKLTVKTDAERKKDISEGIEALYTDAYNKATDGEVLTIQDVLGNEKYRKQLDGLDEGRIQELVNDANILAQYDEYDMQNVLSIYDKYKDMGLLLDYTKLSPNSKTAYINAMMQANEGDNTNNRGLWNYVDKINWISPVFFTSKLTEGLAKLITDKDIDIKDANLKLRDKLGSMKHDYLSQEEIDAATKDERAKLDEKYKQYYTVDKDGNKKWKDNGQWNKYKEEELKMETAVTRAHGDNSFMNFNKNLVLNLLEVASLVVDMVSEPGTLASGLGSTIVGGAENAAGYGWDVVDYLKNGKWEHKEITQHMAELGGYKDFDEALEASEYKLKDSPFKDLGMGILRQLKNDTETAGMLGNYIYESYGSLDKFVQAFRERPAETFSDIITTLQGLATFAGKTGMISAAKETALVEGLGKLDPFEQMMKYGNKLNYGPLLKSETWLLKQGGKAIKLPFKGVKNMGEMVINKLSGLSEEERKFIRENPEDVDKFIKGEENSQSLIDKIKNKFDELTADRKKEGEEYNKIKESDMKIDAKAIKEKISEILDNFGVKIGEKGAEFTKVLPTSIENKAKELVKFVNDYNKKGDTPLASETHYLRQLVDTLANWENKPQGLEADFVNAVKDIRRTIDGALKEQVPGMKEIDAKYSALLGDIKALRQDWFNKDGTLKDSAYSKIRNLTNKGSNQPKLERLESQIPGITQDLKALAVSETVEKASKQMVGQYAQQIWGVGAPITALTSLLTGGLNIPAAVLGLLGMQFATPKNLVSLLKFGGKIDKKINGILDKIINGTKLTALETAELARYLNENKGELRDKVEYMHKKGLLDDTEYKKAVEKYDLKNQEYDRAQTKARNAAGDKEKTMTKEDEKAVLDWVKNNAKNPGWVVRVLDETGMMKALKEAGEKAEKGTQGFFYDKYINLLENPTDTTAQHEFFHAVFSVVDSKTKDYLLQEARKILKENNMDKVAAEEWLAESFGIYAKRKMIDTGVIKAPRNFEQKLRNFFQKVYEWIQNFNGDRKTINKVFDEIYGGKKKIGKKGQLDLSFLLEDKKVDKKLGVSNGLRKKSVYHGSHADFDKFDSSHMGEGEGAQAHGWGHYVAVDKKTAERYADMKNPTNYEYKGRGLEDIKKELLDSKPGEKVELIPIKQMLDSDWMSRYQKGERFDEIKKEGLERAKREMESTKEIYEENPEGKLSSGMTYKERYEIDKRLYNAWKNLDKKDFDFEKPNRNLYTNEIPDPVKADTPTGSNYLEEKGELNNKELEKFSRKLENELGFEIRSLDYATMDDVKKMGEKLGWGDDFVNEVKEDLDAWKDGDIAGAIVKELKYGVSDFDKFLKDNGFFYLNDRNIYNGGKLYEHISKLLGSPKAASKFLESLGYDGIHYYGGRDGEAYVIFNDDALQIKDHIRYKKKIGDKDVEITPKVTSPDELIEKNADGLSVMKSFISEKQAEKALNVNKALLDKDGNAYLWTHTNKYDAPQFANFENTKDSKYKEFGDYEIAWFSNSEDMSRSYANQESKLADTKPINSIEEFNDRFSKYDIDGTPYDTEWKKGDNKEWKYGHKTSIDKEGNEYVLNQYDSESHKYKDLETLYNEWHNGGYDGQSEKEVIDGIKQLVHEEFIDSPDFRLYDDVDIKKEKDGYVLTTSSKKELGRYKTEQEALAKSTAKKHVSGKYHYQGIITDIKNPLVVDLGKYKPGEIKRFRDGDKIVGEHGRYWSDLGNAYDFVKKEQPNVDEIFSKVEKEWGGAKKASNDIKYYAFDIEREGDNLYKAYKDMEEGPAKKFAEDRLMAYRKAGDIIGYISRGVVDELKPEWRNLRVESDGKTTTIGNLYDKAISEYNKYKDVFDVFGEGNRIWKESGKYSQPEGYDKSKTKNFINLLKKNGMGEGAISILHGTDLMNRIDLVYSPFASEGWAITKLRDKSLQTNDYVFYALRKGGYDGVLFKDIIDYGGKGDNKGGDVLAAFKSSDFKAWDNSTPTDSKYISYKKKVSLDKKSEGLQKKNSSGLLAKGRERTLGDDGMRYKTNISDKDSSGKKLSEGQKKFFAGSKVVDRDGNLLRVYHGTRGRFTVFDNSKGDYVSNSMAKIGNWFTPSKEGAKKWAEENSLGMKPKAMGGYLDIKNPKIYEKWDTTEHLKKTGKARENAIEGINKYLDNIGFNPLKNEWNKKYFEKAPEGYENRYKYGQNEAINKALEGLNYLSKVQDLESYLKYDFSDKKKFYDAMKEKGYSDNKIREIAKEAGAWLKKMEDIGNELKKAEFTDAYELFENDLRSFGGQTIKDRVGGGWMAMDDEAKAVKDYVKSLKDQGYDGIIIKATEYDGDIFGEINDQYVAFDSNQFKLDTNKNPSKDQDIRYKAAWHGSPAKFDKFDSSHMGEGEGAQAHGWGHYVALDRKTAEKYAEMRDENLTTRKLGGLTAKQWSSKYNGGDNSADTYAKWKVANGMQGNFFGTKSLEEAKKNAIYLEKQTLDKYKGWLDNKPSMIDGKEYIHADGGLYHKDVVKSEVKKMEDRIKAMEGLSEKDLVIENKNIGKRNLYELDIPEPEKRNTPTGKNYLDEDTELSKTELNKFADELDKSKKLRSLSDMNMDDVKKIGEIIGEKDYVEQVKNSLEKHPEESLSNVAFETLRYYRGEDGLRKYDFYAIKKLQDKLGISAKNSDTFRNANSMNGKYLYKTLSDILGSDKKASKFLESLGYDGIHYVGGQDGEAYVLFKDESPQIKNTIRYKKGLQKKLSKSEQDIMNDKTTLESLAKAGGLKYNNHSTGNPIEDTLMVLKDINPNKKGNKNEKPIKVIKNGLVEKINKEIDNGNGKGWSYKWFFDPLEPRNPTVVYWKGNDMKKEVLAGREISFHQPKGKKYKYVPRGTLTLSPVRLRDWGRLK